MFCSSCGKELPEESKFCSICGATVAGEELIQKSIKTLDKELKKHLKKTLKRVRKKGRKRLEEGLRKAFLEGLKGKEFKEELITESIKAFNEELEEELKEKSGGKNFEKIAVGVVDPIIGAVVAGVIAWFVTLEKTEFATGVVAGLFAGVIVWLFARAIAWVFKRLGRWVDAKILKGLHVPKVVMWLLETFVKLRFSFTSIIVGVVTWFVVVGVVGSVAGVDDGTFAAVAGFSSGLVAVAFAGFFAGLFTVGKRFFTMFFDFFFTLVIGLIGLYWSLSELEEVKSWVATVVEWVALWLLPLGLL